MFNFGSFISISKNLLIIVCTALVVYGISLLVKLILNKTGKSAVWENWVGKYWTVGIFVLSSIAYMIAGACLHYPSVFVNGILNGCIFTALEVCMFRIIKWIIDLFGKLIKK